MEAIEIQTKWDRAIVYNTEWNGLTCDHSRSCDMMVLCTESRLAPVLKHFFINVSYNILVASQTLMALLTEPVE